MKSAVGGGWRRLVATGSLGAWILVICWAIVILVLLIQPGDEQEFRKIRFRVGAYAAGHAAFFAAFGFLLTNALAKHGHRRLWWWSVVIAGLYGIVGEIVQSAVPGRTPSTVDIGADMIGALAGAVTWTILARWQRGVPFIRAARVWSPHPPTPPPPPPSARSSPTLGTPDHRGPIG